MPQTVTEHPTLVYWRQLEIELDALGCISPTAGDVAWARQRGLTPQRAAERLKAERES